MKLVISETVNDIPVVTEKENTILIADFDAGAGAVPLTTVTGKGSLIVGTANATVDELVVGTNGQVPIADSGETAGIRWGSPAGSFVASDAENRTLSATLVLTDADAYVQYCDPGGANRDITLPAEGTGNHAFWIHNAADAAETLTIKNDATATIATLTQGQSALLVSSDTTWTALYTPSTKVLDDGWAPVADTWTYASATTITVPAGAAAIYSVGDKIKLTANSVVLCAYIVTVADTLLTVKGDALTSHTFTSCYYSKAASPLGFTHWFDYSPGGISDTNATVTGRFSISGRTCKVNIYCVFTGAITFTTMPLLPIASAAGIIGTGQEIAGKGVGGYTDSGTLDKPYGLTPTVLASQTTTSIKNATDGASMSATVPITWANNDKFNVYFEYEI